MVLKIFVTQLVYGPKSIDWTGLLLSQTKIKEKELLSLRFALYAQLVSLSLRHVQDFLTPVFLYFRYWRNRPTNLQ